MHFESRKAIKKRDPGLILYVSTHPNDADDMAERLVVEFDPCATIARIDPVETETSTPRLLASGDFFRGVRSIEGFIEQLKLDKAARL